MRTFATIFFALLFPFNSSCQWVQSNITQHVNSIIGVNDALIASVSFKKNETNYCKVFQSLDCGESWTEIFDTKDFKYISRLFAKNDTIYFIGIKGSSLYIGFSNDMFLTYSAREIPELLNRILYNFYVFDNGKVLFASNKGLGIYENGVFQNVNLRKFGRNASSTIIRFHEGNVYANYGTFILISKDTCHTWQSYLQYKPEGCEKEVNNRYYCSIQGFDFFENFIIFSSGNADYFGMYYCDTTNIDSIIKIESINPTQWARPMNIQNKIFSLPLNEKETGMYYLDENFNPIFLQPIKTYTSGQATIGYTNLISYNGTLISGTTNGIYLLKNFEK